MSEWIWRNGKLYTPWVEMKTSATTLEISLDVSQKH